MLYSCVALSERIIELKLCYAIDVVHEVDGTQGITLIFIYRYPLPFACDNGHGGIRNNNICSELLDFLDCVFLRFRTSVFS